MAVIDAAEERFVEQGYATTSIAEIARVAGVSPETVYAIFGTKRELLRVAVFAAATGMVEGGMVVSPELLARVRAEPDARRRLEIMGEATSQTMLRSGPLEAVVRRPRPAIPRSRRWRPSRTRRSSVTCGGSSGCSPMPGRCGCPSATPPT